MTTTLFKSAQKNPQNPGVDDIDPKELMERQNEVMIVDVRRPDEYDGEMGHIVGAKLMVLDTLPERIHELPKDKTIVFVCAAGGRSGRATAFAKAQGFTKAFNLRGGMSLWTELQLPVEGRSDQ